MAARPPLSTAAPPLDSDDLLSEILLRLPPQPSSLPRASAVCKRWRRLICDPQFLRRFRVHHRCNPPLLGFFHKDIDTLAFVPTLEPPNRVPDRRFSLWFDHDDGDRFWFLGCRHGIALIFHASTRFHKLSHPLRHQVLVWDPVTGDKHTIAIPAEFDTEIPMINGAVIRAARDVQHFRVVLVVAHIDDKKHIRVLACVYSSETSGWGDLISTPVSRLAIPITAFANNHSVLIGNSLYWMLAGNQNLGILEFDLERKSLDVIQGPLDMFANTNCEFQVVRAEGGGLGFLTVPESDFIVQLWKRRTCREGVASWVLERTFQMDKLLPLNPEHKGNLIILGFGESNNVVFLSTAIGLFMVYLETLQFKELFKTNTISLFHPFESIYATGTSIGDGHDAAELLQDR